MITRTSARIYFHRHGYRFEDQQSLESPLPADHKVGRFFHSLFKLFFQP
ncbi:hypothetical protein HanLR1_Chr14g0535611 [Helianthus annuus]|nr:hypothetical protein HanLR1_Chr14g0535611 [Helianthus annuus]